MCLRISVNNSFLQNQLRVCNNIQWNGFKTQKNYFNTCNIDVVCSRQTPILLNKSNSIVSYLMTLIDNICIRQLPTANRNKNLPFEYAIAKSVRRTATARIFMVIHLYSI